MSAPSSPIRWLVFDLVDTLIFADPPVHMAYHRMGRAHGSAITPEQALQRFRESFVAVSRGEHFERGATSEAAERTFWQAVVARVLPDVDPAGPCFDALFEHFARPEAWGCFADVDEVLTELQDCGYRLAAASNFDSRLHRVCAGHPPLRGLAPRLASSELGWRKPAPEFFQAAAERCGARPEELLMIGDDAHVDVAAARAAGWRAVQLDRSGKSAGALRSLTELLDWLPRQLSPLPAESSGHARG